MTPRKTFLTIEDAIELQSFLKRTFEDHETEWGCCPTCDNEDKEAYDEDMTLHEPVCIWNKFYKLALKFGVN